MKALIIDPALHAMGGHHYTAVQRLQAELARLGVDAPCLGSAYADRRVQGELACAPTFTRSVYGRSYGAPGEFDESVEETLRHASPLEGTTWRRTTEAVDLGGGALVPAGASVLAVLAAANRDPSRYPDPDAFRPERYLAGTDGAGASADAGVDGCSAANHAGTVSGQRRAAPHVAFGHGPHFCVGSRLARLEAQRVVYVSCNPTTLAANVKTLAADWGYRLEPHDGGTLVTSIYDWSAVEDKWKPEGTWPIIPELSLKATLGILERTVAPRA